MDSATPVHTLSRRFRSEIGAAPFGVMANPSYWRRRSRKEPGFSHKLLDDPRAKHLNIRPIYGIQRNGTAADSSYPSSRTSAAESMERGITRAVASVHRKVQVADPPVLDR